jgi:hypothetical protein
VAGSSSKRGLEEGLSDVVVDWGDVLACSLMLMSMDIRGRNDSSGNEWRKKTRKKRIILLSELDR